MSETGKIEFILRGKQGDIEISPDNISLTLLSNFTRDISDLLSSVPESKKDDIVVSIKDGSFKIHAFVLLAALNIFKADFDTLLTTNNLSTINDKRSKIIEEWIKKVKSNSGLEFEIIPENHPGIKINSQSNFNRLINETVVESEVFLYGIVTDLGGASKTNIHLKTEDGNTFVISCSKEDLAKEKENHVYHSAAIRVFAKQNLYTGEISEPKFIEFINYSPSFDEQELLATIEKGRNAWSDVKDHVEWVRNLRSGNE
jgi:HSP20 family molecular chaperone IbpA